MKKWKPKLEWRKLEVVEYVLYIMMVLQICRSYMVL